MNDSLQASTLIIMAVMVVVFCASIPLIRHFERKRGSQVASEDVGSDDQ